MGKKRKCVCARKRKHIPYGAKKKLEWCPYCDGALVEIVDKGSERLKANIDVKKELEETDE